MCTYGLHLVHVLHLGDPSVEAQLHRGHGHRLELVDVVELLEEGKGTESVVSGSGDMA